MKQVLKIYHLYPDAMNLYGDLGNILSLQRRCQWRGIEVEIKNIFIGERCDFSDADIIFIGGGQDRGQKIISPDLISRGEEIRKEIEKGLVALTICGGFQLFGKYFKTKEGEKIPGISVFDAHTIAGDARMIGNIVVDMANTSTEWQAGLHFPQPQFSHTTLVGFENHSGKTYIAGSTRPLGYVIKGFGNVGDGGYEGGVYKNAYGTYLHGSLLPKNPWLADHLILMGLFRRYGQVVNLSLLDDRLEVQAHQAAIKRADTAKTVSI